MTVKEHYEAAIAAAEAEVAKLKAEFEALPVEAHAWEVELWAKIKSFFRQSPSAAAAPELGQPAPSAPVAPPAP